MDKQNEFVNVVAFATENKKFIMDIGFGRMEPPKKAFQWLQRVQSPHFRFMKDIGLDSKASS